MAHVLPHPCFLLYFTYRLINNGYYKGIELGILGVRDEKQPTDIHVWWENFFEG